MERTPAALRGLDWAEVWKEDQRLRRAPDDAAYWDRRAPSFQKTAGTSPYARAFIERCGVRPGETVFDMGCGSGTLALPLAAAGTRVVARDFSPVMLDLMMRRAQAEGYAERIDSAVLAWADDWDAARVPVCDVAVASRSIATEDLQDALLKLESRARRRVCLTLSCGVGPRHDAVLLQAVGRKLPQYPEHVLCMNILWQLGRRPSLGYIESDRQSTYDSPEHAVEKNAELMEVTPHERALLEEYTAAHLRQVEGDEGLVWQYDHRRVISWAFISWDL